MLDNDQLADQFEVHRAHLHAVAQRLLGSSKEADDAVQEAWLRLTRADTAGIRNLGGWLTTVVCRISLDMLRSRGARREDPVDVHQADPSAGRDTQPEDEALLTDAVASAMFVVLDTLAPAERLAFVLHDSFAVPFDEISPILGRSVDATKQLASRARRKVRIAGPDPEVDPARQRSVIDAFLAASRNGDFDALVALLHPDVVIAADVGATEMGAPETVSGATAVAGTFSGRALGAQPALVDGAVGIAWIVGGQPKVVWDVAITDGKVVHMDMLASPDTLALLDLTALD